MSLAMHTVFPAFCAGHATQDPALLNLTFGQVGIDRHVNNPWRYGIEYRLRSFGDYRLIPSVGFSWVDNGASFLYGELRHDFWLADGLVLTPSFGLGAFNESTEFRLGKTLEFRSGLEIAYQFGARRPHKHRQPDQKVPNLLQGSARGHSHGIRL